MLGITTHSFFQRRMIGGGETCERKGDDSDSVMFSFNRASDDLNTNMVAVDTMEQFQKELDQGKVSATIHSRSKIPFSPQPLIV